MKRKELNAPGAKGLNGIASGLGEMCVPLSDDQLDAVAGGKGWDKLEMTDEQFNFISECHARTMELAIERGISPEDYHEFNKLREQAYQEIWEKYYGSGAQ